jgi:peptidoglycan/LPS O-acetylase OafA/YrhL
MLVMLLPNVTVYKLEQFWNALFPMLVTLLGIVTSCTLAQDANAPLPMLLTGRPLIWLGMITEPP